MQYWYLWVIFIALCLLTVFVLRKASAALGTHNADREAAVAELKRLKMLKEKYKEASEETVQNAEPMELLEGANAVMQSRIEKAEDAEACFATFNEAQQYLYTLLYYLEDSDPKPQFFLRNNGEPLLSLAAPALEAIGEAELSTVVATYFNDQKEKGEVLTDEQLQNTYAEAFQKVFNKSRILENIKRYAIAHRQEIFF